MMTMVKCHFCDFTTDPACAKCFPCDFSFNPPSCCKGWPHDDPPGPVRAPSPSEQQSRDWAPRGKPHSLNHPVKHSPPNTVMARTSEIAYGGYVLG